ncbi:PREDICTED: protein KAKU4-like isoform X2 [Lupinus angustifolius]|uniref:protein KAKU4-like isoform X2 n=1 Tax=Lupinus angustifolius TaxID=3871 RepID=UPI00092FD82B|nr:PREDICTED: protein KAKU4-like isoform X2 [Lupinus angustifolius]
MTSIPNRSRSGGKIVRPRRTSAARATTPYSRPSPANPNWLSRFVISPTRFVASGAGKILSTVLDLDSSPTSSSSVTSSPHSSDTDSNHAEEEVATFDDENDAGNNKNKHFIEQLVMQETFSREECDRLIKRIRSRVVDSPANDGEGDKRLGDMPNMILDNIASPDLCNAAVMEAKKWLQEKKSGLDSNFDLGYGSRSLNLATLPQAPNDEGSPVDLAKSYMRTLPPWSSPSLDHIKPPTLAGIQLFKDEEPHLFGGNSTSSSKLKKDSSATRSWSIQDELRRVRSRATEEMLRTLPSSKIDWSTFSMEYKNNVNSSAIKNTEATLGEKKVHDLTNFVDASSNLARGLGTQATPDLESKLDAFLTESVLPDPANINSEQKNEGFGAVQQTEGSRDECGGITTLGQREGLSYDMRRDDVFVKVNGTNSTNEANGQLDSLEETVEAISFRVHDGDYSEFKEKVGADNTLANGLSPSGLSLYAGEAIEQNRKALDNEPSTVDLSRERPGKVVLEQGTCMLSSESIEVPDMMVNDTDAVKENDGVASASQNSSSIPYEAGQQGSESELAATSTSIAKQKGKRITTRYNRRGRGRRVQ